MRPPRLGKASTNASWSRSVLPLKEESADNLQFIPQETWSSSNREADGRYTGAPCMEEIVQDAQEVVKLVPHKSERNSGLLRPPMPRILEETVDPLERSKILKLGPTTISFVGCATQAFRCLLFAWTRHRSERIWARRRAAFHFQGSPPWRVSASGKRRLCAVLLPLLQQIDLHPQCASVARRDCAAQRMMEKKIKKQQAW